MAGPIRLTSKGPELEKLADDLYDQLPPECIANCGLALAVRCAISDSVFSLPTTPEGARFMNPTESGYVVQSSSAEQALRNMVNEAREEECRGPSGDNPEKCGLDRRQDVIAPDYAGKL